MVLKKYKNKQKVVPKKCGIAWLLKQIIIKWMQVIKMKRKFYNVLMDWKNKNINIPLIYWKYSDIEKGANKRVFESAIDWLESSDMVYKCKYINKVEPPLKVYTNEDTFKLYLNINIFIGNRIFRDIIKWKFYV